MKGYMLRNLMQETECFHCLRKACVSDLGPELGSQAVTPSDPS